MDDASPSPSGPESLPGAAPPPSAPAADSPYRNLWVPLVVVPFLVVAVLVCVFFFFGAISGREATMEENLATLVDGGTNERKQAAVRLVSQVAENRRARELGREPPFEAETGFLERLQEAWRAMGADDNPHLRFALAKTLQEHGDPDVLAKLRELLALDGEADSDGQVRFVSLIELGVLADPRGAPDAIPFLQHADPGLRQAAAIALQSLPGEASVEALKGALGDPELEVRGMAAISLTHLGDASGAAVLADLTDPATYEAVRAVQPRKYADPGLVRRSRVLAVQALARLARPEDRELFRRLSSEEEDPEVREAAMEALPGR